MVECELPKLNMRVRFPLPAPINKDLPCGGFFIGKARSGSEHAKAGSTTRQRQTEVCRSANSRLPQ